MPVLSVQMAQPYNRESQVYILPTEQTISNAEVNLNRKKYVIIKSIEFVSKFYSMMFSVCLRCIEPLRENKSLVDLVLKTYERN